MIVCGSTLSDCADGWVEQPLSGDLHILLEHTRLLKYLNPTFLWLSPVFALHAAVWLLAAQGSDRGQHPCQESAGQRAVPPPAQTVHNRIYLHPNEPTDISAIAKGFAVDSLLEAWHHNKHFLYLFTEFVWKTLTVMTMSICSIKSSVWTGCVLIMSVLHFFLTMTSKLTLPLAAAAWCRAWFLEVSVGSALLASGHDSLEDLISPWSFCCLFDFRTGWSWCSSADGRISSGFSSSRRLGGLLNFFLVCTGSLCCISGWICSGSGLLSSGGGSSTETRLATREEGSTAVTTRVTLRGKGAWRNTMRKY